MAHIHTPEDIIALLHDIDRRSRQKAAGLNEQDSSGINWTGIGFQLGSHALVIALNELKEVFPLPEHITPVPKAQSWVVGMVNLRGDLVPVFDLQFFLEGIPTKVTQRSRIILINSKIANTGVIVDEVYGLKHFPREAEVLEHHDPKLSPYLNGRVFQQDVRWDVFSFERLMQNPQFMNAAA